MRIDFLHVSCIRCLCDLLSPLPLVVTSSEHRIVVTKKARSAEVARLAHIARGYKMVTLVHGCHSKTHSYRLDGAGTLFRPL